MLLSILYTIWIVGAVLFLWLIVDEERRAWKLYGKPTAGMTSRYKFKWYMNRLFTLLAVTVFWPITLVIVFLMAYFED